MNITDMDKLLDELVVAEREASDAKEVLKELNLACERIRGKIFEGLQDSGLEKFSGSAGTVSIATRFNVKMPKDFEVKEELKQYLSDKEVFDSLWSINHQTLNSWFKQEAEQAQAEGLYLDVPGLEPTSDKILRFRKG